MRTNKLNFLNYICILVPIFCLFSVINYFAKIVPFIKFNNMSLFTPLYISIFGSILCIVVLRFNKALLVKIALVLNILIVLLEVLFIVFGMFFFIH